MEKRTLYAAVLVVLLGLGAWAAMHAPDKGEKNGLAARPFSAIKAADIVRLEVTTQKGEKTTLEKKDGTWRVTAPGDWPGDAMAIKMLTDGIEKLGFGDIVTENQAKHAELGVGDTGAAHLKIVTGTQSPDFALGQTVAGFTMLRIAGKNEVWQATNLPVYLVNKPPKDWRDHAIVTLAAADVSTLVVEAPSGNKLVVEKQPEQPGEKKPPQWKVTSLSGDGPSEGDFDNSQPLTVAQALAQLRAFDFADDKSPKDCGLDPPALTITATAKGKAQGIEIGAQQGDDYFVRRVGEPTIFVTKKYQLDHAAARPIDYRDKGLLRLKADDIAKIHVVNGKDDTTLSYKDGKWMLPTGPADDTKAKAFVGGADGLFGTSFVTDKSFKTELDKPRATITVEPKSGKPVVLQVGALTAGNAEYFVQLAGHKDLLVAKKFSIDRLLKKPSELVASAPPPGAQAAKKLAK